MMKSSFTLTKLDKNNLVLKDYKKKIKKMLEIFLQLEEIKTSRVFCPEITRVRFCICFCNDKTIQEINKQYRNKDCPTDVITFSLFVDDDNSVVYRKTADLGEIIVSIETAQRQKKESLEKEILTLILHGILHLFGFDHLTKKDYDFIVKIQDKIIGEL